MSAVILNLFNNEKCNNVTKRIDNKSVVRISEDMGTLPVAAVSWLKIDACWWTDLHQITLKCKIGSWIIPKIPIKDEFLDIFPRSSLNFLETK